MHTTCEKDNLFHATHSYSYTAFTFQGSEKDKRKEAAEKEEKAKKVSSTFSFCFFFSLNVLSLFLHNYLFNYSSIYLFLACAHVFIEVCKRADLLSRFLCYNTYLVHNTNN